MNGSLAAGLLNRTVLSCCSWYPVRRGVKGEEADPPAI